MLHPEVRNDMTLNSVMPVIIRSPCPCKSTDLAVAANGELRMSYAMLCLPATRQLPVLGVTACCPRWLEACVAFLLVLWHLPTQD